MDPDQPARIRITLQDALKYYQKSATRLYLETQERKEKCLQIVQKPPDSRTPEDDELFVAVLKEFECLESAAQDRGKNDKGLLRLSKLMEYECIRAGEAVSNSEETNDKLYLIFKGKAVSFLDIYDDCFRNGGNVTLVDDDFGSLEGQGLDEQGSKPGKTNNTVLFQPKINRKNIQTLTTQVDLNKTSNKKFTRENPPQTISEVDRSLAAIFSQKGKGREEESLASVDEDYVDMLMEYKLLEAIAEKNPGKYIRDGRFYYKSNRTFQEGDYFGELAMIMHKSKNTNSLIVACQDIHCITIKKKVYQDIFMKRLDSINPNVKFLHEFFPEATNVNVAKLYSLLEETRYPHNYVLFEEEDSPKNIYFIKEGEVNLLKKVQLQLGESPRNFDIATKKKKRVVTAVGKGEVLGEELLTEKNQEYTAIVNSREIIVLKMDKNTYENLNDSYKSLFSAIKNTSKMKHQFRRQQTIQSEQTEKIINYRPSPKAAEPEIPESPKETPRNLFWRLAGVMEKSLLKSRAYKPDTPTPKSNKSGFAAVSPTHQLMKDQLYDNSPQYYKRIQAQEKAAAKEKEKSKLDNSWSPSSRIDKSQEGGFKSYMLRLDSRLDARLDDPSPEPLSVASPKGGADEYLFFKNRPTSTLQVTKNESSFSKNSTTNPITISSPILSPRGKKKLVISKLRIVSPGNESEEESISMLKEPESSVLLSSGRKALKPPTSAGYYSVKTKGLIAQKNLSTGQVKPARDVAVYGKLFGVRKAQEKSYEVVLSPGTISSRDNSGSTERHHQSWMGRNPVKEEKTEQETVNFHVGKSFMEYFKGNTGNTQQKEESSGVRKTITPRKLMAGSQHNMFRMKTNKEHLKVRYEMTMRTRGKGNNLSGLSEGKSAMTSR